MWGCWSFSPFSPAGFGGGFSLPGLLVWGAVILAAVWAIWVLATGKAHRRGARADRDDALRILRQRLAEGAISAEEFERLRRAVLS